MLTLAVPALLLIPILLVLRNLVRGASDAETGFALRVLNRDGLSGESRPGMIVDLTGGAPITLNGFNPQKEALLVQLPAEAQRMPGPSEGFSLRPSAWEPGTDLLYRGRVLVRLPDVASNQEIDLYVETAA